jgi:hypothetical protein
MATITPSTTTLHEEELPRDVTFDENGIPAGSCTVTELFDELDREFVEFYGEYGRRVANERRDEWNKRGPWEFERF